MLPVLWAAFAGLVAAECTETSNGTSTSCLAPSYSKCVDQCSLQTLEDQCTALPDLCRWNRSNAPCTSLNSSLSNTCKTKNVSADCSAVAGCTWATIPCRENPYCTHPTNSSCRAAANASECAALGAPCSMAATCIETDRCGVYTNDKDSCTAAPGCFYYATQTWNPNPTIGCLPCFSTPSYNIYSQFRGLIGQTCNLTLQSTLQISFLWAFPSATGCDGGTPIPLSMIFWQFPLTCPLVPNSTNSSSSSAPSSSSSSSAPSPSTTSSSSSSGLASGLSFILAVFAASLLLA